jgi:hypothetical protein
VRSGQSVEEAVEDMIKRGVSELRKNAFGDDVEDSKNLLWSREQAWAVLRLLSERTEVPQVGIAVRHFTQVCNRCRTRMSCWISLSKDTRML